MAKQVKARPDGYHTVTPSLVVQDGNRELKFYEKAFGAKVIFRMDTPDGRLMHAELRVGDSAIMVGAECPGYGGKAPVSLNGHTAGLYLYVPDVDAAYDRALKAGAKSAMPVQDMFWGDRMGTVIDPSGHHWSLATHTRDLTPEQIEKAGQEFMASMAATPR